MILWAIDKELHTGLSDHKELSLHEGKEMLAYISTDCGTN